MSDLHHDAELLRTVIEEDLETYTHEGMLIFLRSLSKHLDESLAVEPPVLSREFLDSLIETLVKDYHVTGYGDGMEDLRDAILDSLSQEAEA